MPADSTSRPLAPTLLPLTFTATPDVSSVEIPTLLAPASPTVLAVPVPASVNKLGVHLLLDDGRNRWEVVQWPHHLDYARRAVGNGGYVTQLVRGNDLDPIRWQVFMDLCAERELIPLLRLATTFNQEHEWWEAPQVDPDGHYHTVAATYAEFVASLRWPTEPYYVIVGNEPNHGNEWGGEPDPTAYSRFLIDVAVALRAHDPQVQILNAGFDPYVPHTGSQPFSDGMFYIDEESFLDGMNAAHPEVWSYLDGWASHPYPLGPFTEPPWQQTFMVDLLHDAANPHHMPPPTDLFNRGVNGYEWELWKLARYGVPALPIFITETGWRHTESTDPDATDNGRPLPDAATVALYLELALYGNQGRYPNLPMTGWTPWLTDPRVVTITPFALGGLPSEWGHTNWLALDQGGSILGTYAPFDLLATENAQPSDQ